MFEKVNPGHPDKLADRIAGALVDMAYKRVADPKIAVEVLLGHGNCDIISETSERLDEEEIIAAVKRITGNDKIEVYYDENKQDAHLAQNQAGGFRCGDNGIFKGSPVTIEQLQLTRMAQSLWNDHPYDGKFILDGGRLIICQSNVPTDVLRDMYPSAVVNPLGDWTGGPDVDAGATNRKLGSDMGDGVTGGGLHGKDLSKADVSVNIYAHLRAQQLGEEVRYSCAIGDEYVDGLPYTAIVEIARDYIRRVGGFEKFAEWGLING